MLAADYVAFTLAQRSPYRLTLFARDPTRVRQALAQRGIVAMPECHPLDSFADSRWDGILNFVGVGDPARAAAMGADILRITREWDDRVLDYLASHASCRYLFLSSGAVFGASHADPPGPTTQACFDINRLMPSAYYGVSKFYSEVIHRSHRDRSIIDIRVFNYLSEFADLNHRFLVNEIIAAIKYNKKLSVDPKDMLRDYLSQQDFAQLVDKCLNAPSGYNNSVDAYSLSPISKTEMLNLFRNKFGLSFDVTGGGIEATGAKSNYFSCNRTAETLGYRPQFGSADTLKAVASRILARAD